MNSLVSKHTGGASANVETSDDINARIAARQAEWEKHMNGLSDIDEKIAAFENQVKQMNEIMTNKIAGALGRIKNPEEYKSCPSVKTAA